MREVDEVAVAASVVRAILRAGRARGLPSVDLLKALGDAEDDLHLDTLQITARPMVDLWGVMAARLPAVALGLSVERTGTGIFGTVGYLAQNLPTGRAALQTLAECMRTVSTHMRLDVHAAASGHVRVRCHHLPPVEHLVHPIDLGMAQLVALVTGEGGVRRAAFKHAPIGPVKAYSARFGPNLQFEAAHNELWFSAQSLDRPRLRVDPQLAGYFRRQLRRELREVDAPPTKRARFSSRLRHAIDTVTDRNDFRVSAVAGQMGLSERQLQRLAKRYHVSPRNLIEGRRRKTAQRALRDGSLSVDEIARLLDYADARSFTRAFNRWTGTTPARWRKQRMG